MCYLMGIFGYLTFGPATDGDILDNFAGGWAATTLKCCVAGHLVCYIPGEVKASSIPGSGRHRKQLETIVVPPWT